MRTGSNWLVASRQAQVSDEENNFKIIWIRVVSELSLIHVSVAFFRAYFFLYTAEKYKHQSEQNKTAELGILRNSSFSINAGEKVKVAFSSLSERALQVPKTKI